MAGFQQLRVTREVDFTGATLIGFGGVAHRAGGNAYYVDGVGTAGDDGHLGTNPDYPKDTIASALSSCTANNNDYVFVLDCWSQDTFPVEIGKQQVHVIGIGLPSFTFPKMNPTNDAAVFKLIAAGAYSEIAGFDLSGGDTAGCIWIAGTEGAYIHHCWFGSAGAGGTPEHGIDITQNPQYSRIERCRFFGDLPSSSAEGVITSNGIEVAAAINMVKGVEVFNNIFSGLAIGVNLDNADYWQVENNRFTIPNEQVGEAITLQSDCAANSFLNNLAVYSNTQLDYSYNPYRDLAAGSNHWALNYRGNQIIEPITV